MTSVSLKADNTGSSYFQPTDIVGVAPIIVVDGRTLDGSTVVIMQSDYSLETLWFEQSDGVMCQLEVLCAFASTKQENSPFEVHTSSGMVCGILTRTRRCPRRYREAFRRWSRLTRERQVTISLAIHATTKTVLDGLIASPPDALEILRSALRQNSENDCNITHHVSARRLPLGWASEYATAFLPTKGFAQLDGGVG